MFSSDRRLLASSGASLLFLLSALVPSHCKVNRWMHSKQVVFADAPPHRLKTFCADLMCTSVKRNAHRSKFDWEGDSTYDLPYTFAYVVDVAVGSSTSGSNYEEYSTIVDTGSANLGIAESECDACGGDSTSLLSVAYSNKNCIEVVYGDSKADSTYWQGYESVAVEAGFYSEEGESALTRTTFAAITDASSGSSSFFSGGYSGILGLGYAGISESYYDCSTYQTTDASTPLVDALYADGQLDRNVFAISFCGTTAPLAIGDVDESLSSGAMAYTPTAKTFGTYLGYYLVKVTGFSVGSTSLSDDVSSFNTYGGMLVDSGTTELLLPVAEYVRFANLLTQDYPWLTQDFFSYESCLTSAGVDLLPDMTFELDGGVTLALPAANYLIYYEGCYYWGVSASSMAILGNVATQGLTVVFDREEDQIGFATASCSVSSGDTVSTSRKTTTTLHTPSTASTASEQPGASTQEQQQQQQPQEEAGQDNGSGDSKTPDAPQPAAADSQPKQMQKERVVVRAGSVVRPSTKASPSNQGQQASKLRHSSSGGRLSEGRRSGAVEGSGRKKKELATGNGVWQDEIVGSGSSGSTTSSKAAQQQQQQQQKQEEGKAVEGSGRRKEKLATGNGVWQDEIVGSGSSGSTTSSKAGQQQQQQQQKQQEEGKAVEGSGRKRLPTSKDEENAQDGRPQLAKKPKAPSNEANVQRKQRRQHKAAAASAAPEEEKKGGDQKSDPAVAKKEAAPDNKQTGGEPAKHKKANKMEDVRLPIVVRGKAPAIITSRAPQRQTAMDLRAQIKMNGNNQAAAPSSPAARKTRGLAFGRFLRSMVLMCSGLIMLALLVSAGLAPRRSGPTSGLVARVVDGLSLRFENIKGSFENIKGRLHARPGYAPVADYDDDQFDM